jgi:hypothetical protein
MWKIFFRGIEPNSVYVQGGLRQMSLLDSHFSSVSALASQRPFRAEGV